MKHELYELHETKMYGSKEIDCSSARVWEEFLVNLHSLQQRLNLSIIPSRISLLKAA